MRTFARSAAVALLASAAAAQTNVGGPVVTNTTWDIAGSPYIVQTSVVVGANATLTIEAGVEVRVGAGLGITVGSQAFGPGALIVNGEEDNPVLFTSNVGNNPGDWNDILFTDLALDTVWDQDGNYQSGSRLHHCTILYAGGTTDSSKGALSIDNVSLELVGVAIRESKRQGIDADFDDNITKTLMLSGCEVSESGDGGMDINRGVGHVVSGSSFVGNNLHGLYAYQSPDLLLDSCVFSENGTDGLNLNYCDQTTVQDSECGQNISEGAVLTGCDSMQFISNLVIENGNTGLSTSSCDDILISGSRFETNTASTGAGFNTGSYTHGQIQGCEFVGNHATSRGGGAWLYLSNLTVSDCNFIGNTAGSEGGGLYFNNSNTDGLAVERCVFRQNSATVSGGAIHITNKRVIRECDFEANDAASGGAIYISQTGWVSLAGDQDNGTFNSFWANTADLGDDIYNDRAFNADGSGDIDASFVCWGTQDYNEIGGRIYDFFDDSTKGIVGIFPPVDCQACPADFNNDGLVNTLDVLAYLNAYAAGDSSADFNGDGLVNTLDVLAFLNAWAAGC